MTENDLYEYIIEKAKSYGMMPKNNPKKTAEIKEKGNAIIRHNTKDRPFFAFISHDEAPSGPYNGLSFVVFPDNVNNEIITHCVIAIGIGSSTLGYDTALACNPGFRRSFMKLVNDTNNIGEPQFFFAENWGEMESRTPGLKEAIVNASDTLRASIQRYDDDKQNSREGLLPAACLLEFSTEFAPDPKEGIPVLDAWLAQYAKWRNWDTTKDAREAVNKAINNVRQPSPSNNDLINNVMTLMGLEVKKDSEDSVNTENNTVRQSSPSNQESGDNDKSSKGQDAKHKYIVLQGAPGCGKTRMALNIASQCFDKENVIFTQFHAETTYADFVYGIKPILNGKDLGYEGKKGVLLKAIEKANDLINKEKNVLLIIDEINRANLSNVLGPVFYLFEANAQDHNYTLDLGTVGDNNIEIAKLPDNLYVIATMNTADRSLAVVDFALRRRFTWLTLYPKTLSKKDVPDKFFDETRFNEFNDLFEKYATDDELNLQPGHSYFILNSQPQGDDISEEMVSRLKYELMPLMKEYFNEGYLLAAKEEFCQLFFKYTKEYMYK